MSADGYDRHDPRWEYKVIWRYGPLIAIVIGMAVIAIGLSGLCGTAESTTALPIGLVLMLSGIALPRIQGRFSAGPTGSRPGCWRCMS